MATVAQQFENFLLQRSSLNLWDRDLEHFRTLIDEALSSRNSDHLFDFITRHSGGGVAGTAVSISVCLLFCRFILARNFTEQPNRTCSMSFATYTRCLTLNFSIYFLTAKILTQMPE